MNRRRPGAVRLAFRPPFAWEAMLAFLAPRAIPGVERVRDGTYARTIGRGATIAIARAGARHLSLAVRAADESDRTAIAARVRRAFDLDRDPRPIAEHLGRDRRLAGAVAREPGLRVPGAWDAFEIGVRAILGQQVTVAGATTLSGRLVARFGARARRTDDDALTHVFPSPKVLARAAVESIGLPPVRAEAIRGLARLAIDDPSALADAERLTLLHGIGPWTAAYVAMRAGRDPDALPAMDLGLRRALAPKGTGEPISAAAVAARAERWRPWRAYAVMHLWSEELGSS
jgi:3-methyladenine DNA glycosylase/8-oxoguanine DNA glycosylase